MVELILVVLLLLVGAVYAAVMYEIAAGNTRFSLPFVSILLVTVVGAALFPLGGWLASLLVLGVYAACCLVGGLRARSQSETYQRGETEETCPQCGSALGRRESGGSLAVECVSGCGWNVATTNPAQPLNDPQRYDVLPSTGVEDKKRAVATLVVTLGLSTGDALRIVERNEPIARGLRASEVQRLAKLLGKQGLPVVVRPKFPWPLTDDA